MAPQFDMTAAQDEEPFDDVFQAYEKLDSGWQSLRWRITGPFLILLGLSQAVFGWAGNSLWMRIGYSAACIAFGVFLIAIMGWLSPRASENENPDQADQSLDGP
jgi:hypothetical protein